MAASALIYLAPGAFQQTLDQAKVLYQERYGDIPHDGTLREALNVLSGRSVKLVVTSAEALLTSVTLARKQARHLHRVLPYLLEEQLLDSPDQLWFASGKADHGRYPVAVINRLNLEALLTLCDDNKVRPESLKVDADLLAEQTPVLITVAGWDALLLQRDQALVVDAAQREAVLELHGDQAPHFTRLEDAATLCDQLQSSLAAGNGVECLQGAFSQRQNTANGLSSWQPWKAVMGLAVAVFFIALTAIWAQQWRYQQAADETFAEAAQLYQNLFPGDRATSGLRRQFQARLARLNRGGDANGSDSLFGVLPAVATTLSDSEVTPKRLQFDQRDGSLLLDLGAKEYGQVEKLQSALNDNGVRATIANYRNGASGVTARVKVEQAG